MLYCQFLNYLQARVRELKKSDYPNFTATIMLVGIPNVGKSALANSLHKIGRISAAGMVYWFLHVKTIVSYNSWNEIFRPNGRTLVNNISLTFYVLFMFFHMGDHLTEKGKLKHALVSPDPCETKDIRSLKVIRVHSFLLTSSGHPFVWVTKKQATCRHTHEYTSTR